MATVALVSRPGTAIVLLLLLPGGSVKASTRGSRHSSAAGPMRVLGWRYCLCTTYTYSVKLQHTHHHTRGSQAPLCSLHDCCRALCGSLDGGLGHGGAVGLSVWAVPGQLHGEQLVGIR